MPSCWINVSCVPCWTTCPLSRTIIWSASLIVESRWAMIISVLPHVSSLIAVNNACWFSGSTLDVASSKMIIGASFKIALAIEIRCFSPPDSVEPPSPIIVWYPFGNFSINSWQHARRAASTTSSCVTVGFPNFILFSIQEILNNMKFLEIHILLHHSHFYSHAYKRRDFSVIHNRNVPVISTLTPMWSMTRVCW